MNKDQNITPESFDRMLGWLDPDRERAGDRYESIRRRLITIFTCRGCLEAVDLADETINRVTIRVPEIVESYVGDPARYFYGVAQKVHLEHVRKKPLPRVDAQPPPANDDEEGYERQYECLEACIARLPASSRELVLEYYAEEKQSKIDRRKQLAQRMGIALNALRIRAYRIRVALQECVQGCLDCGGDGGALK